MRNHRAASRYAKSILELASDMNKLDKVNDDMILFNQTIKENRVLDILLRNPIVSHVKKRAVLQALFKDHMDKLTMSAFDLITKKNRENILLLVAQEFLIQYNHVKGLQEARVTTTFQMDQHLTKQFEEVVQRISHKKALLEEVVDESIVGGFVLSVGDRRIDNSIKSKLAEIHKDLTA